MRTKTKYILWVMVIIFFCIYSVLGGWEHLILSHKAYIAYRNSRSDNVTEGSYEFATKGIQLDMSPEQVNQIMSGANKVARKMPQESPPWAGYVNLYIFYYGPKFHNSILKYDEVLFQEWFWVYFDSENHAKIIHRHTIGNNGWCNASMKINLENKSIERY